MAKKKITPPDVSDEKYPEIKPYPAKDDVFNQDEIDREIDPDDTRRHKSRNEDPDELNEKSFEEDMTGEDLDVPGNVKDEHSQGNGEEDEENNYYSQPD